VLFRVGGSEKDNEDIHDFSLITISKAEVYNFGDVELRSPISAECAESSCGWTS